MDDFAWLSENSQEIYQKYAGKWIAVSNGQIVGTGDTAVEAAKQADAARPDGDYILEKVELDMDVIYACLCVAHGAKPTLRSAASPIRIRYDQDRG